MTILDDLPMASGNIPTVGTLPSPSNPMAVAREIVSLTKTADTIRWWRGDFYRWTDTRWEIWPEPDVRSWLYQCTENAMYTIPGKDGKPDQHPDWAPNKRTISDLIDALGHGVVFRQAALESDDGTGFIAFTNGVLDLRTRRLLPHSPERFNLHSLPFAYDPTATCPTWRRFLDEVQPHREGIPDEQQGQQYLQEWYGYSASGRTDLQKIASLIGPSRCGKGTIARVLTAMLGSDAVTAPTLSKMVGSFGEESFIGKSLAIFGDIRWNSRHAAEAVPIFLGISGEDWQTINRKNRIAWEGKLGIRFVLMSNDAPTFNDASGALSVRLIHLEFTESFEGREDTELTKKLLTELPGIFNWALDGLDSLTARGRFVPPANDNDLAAQVARLSSPETAFVQDCCTFDVDGGLSLNALYEAFRNWCDDEGKEAIPTKEVFSRNLQSAFRGRIKTSRVEDRSIVDKRRKVTYVAGLRIARPDDPSQPIGADLPDSVRGTGSGQGRTGSGRGEGQDKAASDLQGQDGTGSCPTEAQRDNTTPNTELEPQLENTLSHPVPTASKEPLSSGNGGTRSGDRTLSRPRPNGVPGYAPCVECDTPSGFGHTATCSQAPPW